MVWKKHASNGSYLLISSPKKGGVRKGEEGDAIIKSSKCSVASRGSLLANALTSREKVARKGNLRSYFHIEATSTNKCQLKHIFHLDLGEDKASRNLAKKMIRKSAFLSPLATKVQEHFKVGEASRMQALKNESFHLLMMLMDLQWAKLS
jgi:hypothetical protein